MVDAVILGPVLNARSNLERARRFAGPIIRSTHPDAVLLGHSVTAVDGVDSLVESVHISRSSVLAGTPRTFSMRTWATWSDEDTLRELHPLDYLAWHPLASPARAQRVDAVVRIDNDRYRAHAVATDRDTFLAVVVAGFLITIAAPGEVLDEPFTRLL